MPRRRDRDKDRDRRGDRDFRDRKRRDQDTRKDRDHNQERKEREAADKAGIVGPIILAKPDRSSQKEREQLDREFPVLAVRKEENVSKDSRNENSEPAGLVKVKELMKPKDGERGETPPVTNIQRPNQQGGEKIGGKLRQPLKLIDESHVFSDAAIDYLTDNQDFTVIGVLGLPNSGKSTLLNVLANSGSDNEDEIFRVQSYEHQMLGEHCTNGVDIFINSKRMIFLDCQPLLSASIMDRTIQLEKKYSSEFGATENSMEMHALQLIGWMFSVCHSVMVVQDWFVDMNLMRLIEAAEMLKPFMPTVSETDQQVVEYFPNFVLVQNRCQVMDFEEDVQVDQDETYRLILSKSRLKWRESNVNMANRPLIVRLPDDCTQAEGDQGYYKAKPRYDYSHGVKLLRRKMFSLKRRQISQAKLTERSWLNMANKAWDAVKNCSSYMEYCRLLP